MKYIKTLSLVALAMLAVACKNDDKAATTQQQKVQVKIAKVTSEDIPQTETYTATVESDLKNNIAPNTPYRIEKIYVDVGDPVRKGQVLVQLDASNLQQLKLQLENQKIEFNRTAQLYQVGGASKAEYDNAKLQLDVFSTQLKQLMENTQLVAPINGVVTVRNYDNGDMYSNEKPILTIEQTNPVKVMVNISEVYYKDIYKGMPIDIQLDAYGDETFYGKVTIVYPTIDLDTHTFPVEVIINNADQRVRPGMFARATVNFGSKNHVLVPDEALVKQIGAGDRYVYVYKDGKVSYNKVHLGKHIGTKYEILDGVNSGDEVVIAGQSRLANGKEVEVVK
ncbi:MAG: efflux RND transporter periplasmic adaptor subunit [Bacteroidaceae bacterium]|jgi:RND family efflux transporter MFP subunit|nr:efflux RND transporter periplasmic adaptor subunit [Bacteroidaceae bacterium]MBR3619691.1 efflux RND transporter periplasmic adaptor subunit [Bacteroidaceae bacterium]